MRRLVVVLAASACVAPAASARVDFSADGSIGAGPVLTEQGLVFDDLHRGVNRIKLVRSDGTATTLSAFNRVTNQGRRTNVDLAASAQRLSVAAWRYACNTDEAGNTDCNPAFTEFATGPFGGPVARLSRCGFRDRALASSGNVAASGDSVAWLGCSGSYEGGPVMVRDLSAPGSTTSSLAPPPGQGFDAVAMEGNYVAAHAAAASAGGHTGGPNTVIVFDRTTGREVYRIDDPRLGTRDWALQHDGKLAVASSTLPSSDAKRPCQNARRLAWFSPQEPTAHPLPIELCWPDARIRMAGDRILFARDVTPGVTQLTVTDLTGRDLLAVAAPITGDNREDYDFDGERIAYDDQRCIGYRVVLDDLASIGRTGFRPSDTCSARLVGRHPIGERRDGTLTVRMVSAHGTRGDILVTRHGRARPFDDRDFTLHPRRTVNLRGPDAISGTRAVHRRKVEITIRIWQPDGSDRTIKLTRTVRTNYL